MDLCNLSKHPRYVDEQELEEFQAYWTENISDSANVSRSIWSKLLSHNIKAS